MCDITLVICVIFNLLSKLFDCYNDIGFNLDVHHHVPNTIFQ